MTDDICSGGRVCFTGHRVISRAALPELPGRIYDLIEQLYGEGFRFFYTGGALGFDTLAAEAVLRLREAHPDVSLTVVRPCGDQTEGWRPSEVQRYEQILTSADHTVLLSERYYNGCMQVRNRYLVDHADFCIAYLTHTRGGSVQTAAYALSKGIPLLNLAVDGLAEKT